MAKFLQGTGLTHEINEMFSKAESCILICSPYIKLHPQIKRTLSQLADKPDCILSIVFGKNEDDLSKSFNQDDFEFLKTLPNVEIKHEPNLHAKYYASEEKAILSSMNLYDFSHNNNIEFGVLTEYSSLKRLGKSMGANYDLDKDAEDFFLGVLEKGNLLFRKEPEFKKTLMGLGKKEYLESKVTKDELSKVYERSTVSGYSRHKSKPIYQKEKVTEVKIGYCIRTGEPIPFNVKQPLSDKAYASWSRFSDDTYSEKYCHFSGEESNGDTSFSKPILKKHWKNAMS